MARRQHERGSLHVVYPGVYVVGHRAAQVEARWMAAVLACGEGAALSHRSAGQLWGLLPRSPHLPEVTRPRSNRHRSGLVVHRSALPDDEVTVVNGIPVTSPFRTIFDLAGTLSTMRQLERAMNEAEVRQPRDRALRGRFFEPDCMWREQRLVVELDGRAVHGTEQAFESDRQRDGSCSQRVGAGRG